MQGVKTNWLEHWKEHNPIKKVTVKVYTENIQAVFFSDKKIFKMKKLYNPHNNVVYVLKKMTNVEVPEGRLFSKTEAFPKQIMVSAVVLKAGNTSGFFCWTKYKSKWEVLL